MSRCFVAAQNSTVPSREVTIDDNVLIITVRLAFDAVDGVNESSQSLSVIVMTLMSGGCLICGILRSNPCGVLVAAYD